MWSCRPQPALDWFQFLFVSLNRIYRHPSIHDQLPQQYRSHISLAHEVSSRPHLPEVDSLLSNLRTALSVNLLNDTRPTRCVTIDEHFLEAETAKVFSVLHGTRCVGSDEFHGGSFEDEVDFFEGFVLLRKGIVSHIATNQR